MYCQSEKKMAGLLERHIQVINVSKGSVLVASEVVWAYTSRERRRGLLGRSSLGADEAMFLTPCEWLHTFRMKFPIDVAFLSADGRVLAIHHRLKPNRLSRIVLRAHGALELAAGVLKRSGTDVGDTVQFVNNVTGELISCW